MSNVMRAAAVCLLGVVVALCGPSLAVAKKPKKRASACQKLKQRGRDIAPSRKLVTVQRSNEESGTIKACVLPRGKVRTLADWFDGLGRQQADVVGTAGTWVLLNERDFNQYGYISRTLTRVQVRTGTTLVLSSYGCQAASAATGCDTGSDYGEVGIARSGAGAIELTDLATRITTLQAFDARGTLTKLANGPICGLRVTSKRIEWTPAGMCRSAPLP